MTTRSDSPKSTVSTTTYESGMPVLHAHAAGIDVASTEHWVCVVTPEGKQEIRGFGQWSPDLHQLVAYLKANAVATVAMESTGVYWVALDDLLEAEGLDVWLVDGRSLKSVKGRPKTDRLDCQWRQRLHVCGLLTRSFIPRLEVRQLRELWRQRDRCIKHGAQLVQRMQKLLVQMNIQLPTVISDITGPSGLRIIRAIVGGERSAAKLAALGGPRLKPNATSTTSARKPPSSAWSSPPPPTPPAEPLPAPASPPQPSFFRIATKPAAATGEPNMVSRPTAWAVACVNQQLVPSSP